MPLSRRLATALAVALGFALPAVASGQTPGDEQYQDPFGGSQPGQEEPAAPAPTATPEPAPAPAAVPEATTPLPGSAESAPAPAVPVADGGGELPRTGAPAGLVAVGGAALLAGGIALRRRTRDTR